MMDIKTKNVRESFRSLPFILYTAPRYVRAAVKKGEATDGTLDMYMHIFGFDNRQASSEPSIPACVCIPGS